MTSLAPANLNENEVMPANASPNILICIPAFNEAERIGRVVSRSRAFGTHILVCDDGSTDDTSSEATKNGAIVACHKKNLGKGAALKTLLREASKFGSDVVVTLDGDGQHDPSDIPRLVAPVLEGTADVVIGCRFSGENRIPLYRRVGNSVLSLMTNWSAGTRIRDTQSGFRAYSSRVLPSISIIENGMGVDSEILIKLAREGFKIEERNVAVTYGGDTSTFNPASHILRVLWSLTRGKYRRIRMIPTVGWIVAAGTIVTALVLLGLVGMPLSWFGFGASMLAFSAGALAVVLSPDGRLIRWIRKGKIARLSSQGN
jgi:glycosyltransferase involved in cell wall biosynthesis